MFHQEAGTGPGMTPIIQVCSFLDRMAPPGDSLGRSRAQSPEPPLYAYAG